MRSDLRDAAAGCMLGLAVGDALGAPFEFEPAGSPRLERWDGWFAEGGPWKLRPGQWTDDTKMAVALAEALIEDSGMYDAERVARHYLAWYASGDLRGIGDTVAGAMARLAAGVSPEESGLEGPHRAGNGSAMRVAPIGLVTGDQDRLRSDPAEDAYITHHDERAVAGSRAVAAGVAMLARGVAADGEWGEAVARSASEPTTAEHIRRACELAMEGAQPPFALLTLGTGGYVVESVASAVYLTMRFAPDDDFHGAVQAAVRAGDDTDTTAAITGALVGAACGLRAIPSALADGVEDGERLVALGQRLADIADGYLLGPEFGAV